MICSFAKHTKHYLCVLVFILKCQYYFDYWKTNKRSDLQSFNSILYLFDLHLQTISHGCNQIHDICCFNLWLYIKLLWWVNTIYCFSIVLLIFKLCGRRSRVTENEMDLCAVLLVTKQHCVTCLCMFNNRECNYRRFLDNVTEEGCFYFLFYCKITCLQFNKVAGNFAHTK